MCIVSLFCKTDDFFLDSTRLQVCDNKRISSHFEDKFD